MANKILVSLPEKFLEDVDRVAAEEHRSRSELIREALRAYLEIRKGKKVREQSASYVTEENKSSLDWSFPNIEIVKSTGGSSAVIRGTRVPVRILIGYLLIGETPETIVEETIPHLTLPQVYEAIRYYFVHRAEIDKEREESTEEASRNLIRKKLGEENYRKITGG